MSTLEVDVNSKTEARNFPPEDVKPIKSHITPLTTQLEDLIRPIQVYSSTQQPIIYPRAGTNASFTAAGYQPDICNIESKILKCKLSFLARTSKKFCSHCFPQNW